MQSIENKIIPISLLREDNLIPIAYIMHIHSQACLTCGLVAEHSNLYAKNDLRSRMTGKPITHLVAVTSFRFNLPLFCMEIPETYVPACPSCAPKIDLADLPPAPTLITTHWLETLAKKDLQATQDRLEAKKKPATSSDKKPKTLSNLLEML